MVREKTRQRRARLLATAHRYVGAHLGDPDLNVHEVAEAVGTSPRQLQRVFGESSEDFRTHLLRVRMERAAALLSRERDALPVGVVARRVGYRQASGLRQAFVRFYGYPPATVQRAGPEYLGRTVFEQSGDSAR